MRLGSSLSLWTLGYVDQRRNGNNQKADVVLAIGTRLNPGPPGYGVIIGLKGKDNSNRLKW